MLRSAGAIPMRPYCEGRLAVRPRLHLLVCQCISHCLWCVSRSVSTFLLTQYFLKQLLQHYSAHDVCEVRTCHTFFIFIELIQLQARFSMQQSCWQLTDERPSFQAASGPTVKCGVILLPLLECCYNVSACTCCQTNVKNPG